MRRLTSHLRLPIDHHFFDKQYRSKTLLRLRPLLFFKLFGFCHGSMMQQRI